MSRVIKITCTGVERHVNEVDLGRALQTISVPRGIGIDHAKLPERIVLRCDFCKEGKIVITDKILDDFINNGGLG